MSYVAIVLASASERRSRLLDQIGVAHACVAADVDESQRRGENPVAYVQRLAREKAAAVVARLEDQPGQPVLAADTTVVLQGRIYGKPVDEADCIAMLSALAGRTHEVLTAIALSHAGSLREALCTSRVTFRDIGTEECRRYWASGEPAGKAGGYAIQGLGAVFVSRLDGSFSGVMGLPLFETAALLDAAGVTRWQAR
jgi:septum formation protein